MIEDHRPDTLTPRLKEVKDLETAAPALLAAAAVTDPQFGQLVRHALRDIHHYHCPIALRLDRAWVLVLAAELTTPNRTVGNWILQTRERKKWQRLVEDAILRALGVASWEYLKTLGRLPACQEHMHLRIVRLVSTKKKFIRDDDNLHFARKGVQDALTKCGLFKDDRREWLTVHPTVQDVAPNGRALTVFFLWPHNADPKSLF